MLNFALPVYVYTTTLQLQDFSAECELCFLRQITQQIWRCYCCRRARKGGQELTVNAIISLMMARRINIVSNEVGSYAGGKV